MQTKTRSISLWLLLLALVCPTVWADDGSKPPPETKIEGPGGLPIVVRMQGPYDADVPLQVVCYFRRTDTSDQRLVGAPLELDHRLGGLIGALRSRGEFAGDELETFLIDVPAGTIFPKRLLLVGLGDEQNLSLDVMERVGRLALREAVRIGAPRVAFAPLIKDAGNSKLLAGDVERAVARGVLLAYDTEQRLQAQGFAKSFRLESWLVEAGPTYYDETIAGVKAAIKDAHQEVEARSSTPYSTKSLPGTAKDK